MSYLQDIPVLKPFSGTKEEFDQLLVLASEDGHTVFFPTDVIWKGGERVGWFSSGVVPTAWAWLSTKKMKIRDSLQIVNTVENVQMRLGAPGIYLPCAKESPFYPYLEKIGYTNGGSFDFFWKEFRK